MKLILRKIIERASGLVTQEIYIALLFLASGFSALIYQVVWQRALFTNFGINSEAVTVIVSIFMFGIGMGALVGGYLQKAASKYLLHIFIVLEISIGVYGVFSLDIIRMAGQQSSASTTENLVLWTYLVLGFPTLCMGATLPILVGYIQKNFNNFGKTIGLLYASNTFGSAVAAFFTVQVMFAYLGQTSSIYIAAACNLMVATLIYKVRHNSTLASIGIRSGVQKEWDAENEKSLQLKRNVRIPTWFAFVCLFAIGYIALSQEIIWFRLLGFLTGGRPHVFGFLLASFLIGIAAGSMRSKQICERESDPVRYLLLALLFSALIFYLSIPTISMVTGSYGKDAGIFASYLLVAVVAFLTGGVLPMLIHISIDQQFGGNEKNTQKMSLLYFANILGSTFGPLLTGFLLLNVLTVEDNVVVLTVINLVLLMAVLVMFPKYGSPFRVFLIVLISTVFVREFMHKPMYRDHLETLQYGSPGNKPFKHVVENRASIITVADARGSDIIYGGGVYDGRFNTDPVENSNWIDRAFMVAALHPRPEKILEIGLSSGSWSKVLSTYKPLVALTVVEINKGYLDVIKSYPEIEAAISGSKVKLVFDDGRRWLRNNPEENFDAIVMNTTFYWRSNSTNLLSREFFELCKSRLKPGGVIYLNTTGLRDTVFTAANVFKHVTTYRNFVAASDEPFLMSTDGARENLLQFMDEDGAPVFAKSEKHRALLTQLSQHRFEDIRESVLKEPNLRLITDDNMFPEYKADYRP